MVFPSYPRHVFFPNIHEVQPGIDNQSPENRYSQKEMIVFQASISRCYVSLDPMTTEKQPFEDCIKTGDFPASHVSLTQPWNGWEK